MYRKRIAALLIVLAAVAATTASAASAPVQLTVAGHQLLVYQPHGKPRGRVILLHGLGGSAQLTWPLPTFNLLPAGLTAQGYQVVAPDLPDTTPGAPDNKPAILADLSDGTQGAHYAAEWQTEFQQIRGWADRRYGKLPLIVGGISWGGFHSLYAACHNRVDGWFALFPVTDPTKLSEYQGMDLSKLTVQGCGATLARTRGLIEIGLVDGRVDGLATEAFARTILAAHRRLLAVRDYPELGHTTSPETIGDALAWTARFQRAQ